ncbi:HNH endonuclease [Microbacterium sp.]|uniref:HNH endonuclease n=1 Tax=Microbacterium sp. TaxID=51671 RepID=UPI0028A59C2F|nr:HNH endonuclease [Microbacterium sp.]
MVQNGRSDALRKRHRARIAKSKPACYLCGEQIDFSLKYPDPMCFVVDHVVPIAKGGSDALANKKAAHHSSLQRKEGHRSSYAVDQA